MNTNINNEAKEMIFKLARIKHIANQFSFSDLAELLGVSRAILENKVKKELKAANR